MRGYLKRVQEDDVVREELVPIGDPQGEQQLVPKRKPTPFMAPTPYSDFSNRRATRAMGYTDRAIARSRGTGSRTDVLVHAGHPHAGLRSFQLPAFEGNHGQPESHLTPPPAPSPRIRASRSRTSRARSRRASFHRRRVAAHVT
jgi:hypothetical protein